jgi:hypothetical protein
MEKNLLLAVLNSFIHVALSIFKINAKLEVQLISVSCGRSESYLT